MQLYCRSRRELRGVHAACTGEQSRPGYVQRWDGDVHSTCRRQCGLFGARGRIRAGRGRDGVMQSKHRNDELELNECAAGSNGWSDDSSRRVGLYRLLVMEKKCKNTAYKKGSEGAQSSRSSLSRALGYFSTAFSFW